jgi:hypothetical protein
MNLYYLVHHDISMDFCCLRLTLCSSVPLFREMYKELCWDFVSELSEAYSTDPPTVPPHAGQPKRYLLTTGWSVFVSAKRLLAGDSVLFIRYIIKFTN